MLARRPITPALRLAQHEQTAWWWKRRWRHCIVALYALLSPYRNAGLMGELDCWARYRTCGSAKTLLPHGLSSGVGMGISAAPASPPSFILGERRAGATCMAHASWRSRGVGEQEGRRMWATSGSLQCHYTLPRTPVAGGGQHAISPPSRLMPLSARRSYQTTRQRHLANVNRWKNIKLYRAASAPFHATATRAG